MYDGFGQRAAPGAEERMLLVASAIPSKAWGPRSHASAEAASKPQSQKAARAHAHAQEHGARSCLPRIVPLKRDAAHEGLIFAHTRDHEFLIVYRTEDEKAKSPERLNLDRRQLTHCPVLYNEQRLRLLNFQHNAITAIRNVDNLPNLIFLDLYSNKISSLEGSLSCLSGLRVFMAGKNRISRISNLDNLKKLDVLDLHSNDIHRIESLNNLVDLRVLNLAGNKIRHATNLSSLQSLTELNLRRNRIVQVDGLDAIESLQRVFLSHNQLATLSAIQCIFELKQLQELSLDGNPLAEGNPAAYRQAIASAIPTLKHLDLKPISQHEQLPVEDGITESLSNAQASGVEAQSIPKSEQAVVAGATELDDLSSFDLQQRLLEHQDSNPSFDVLVNRTIPGTKILIVRGEAWDWMRNRKYLAAISECRISGVSLGRFVEQLSRDDTKLAALRTAQFKDVALDCGIDKSMALARALPNLQHLIFDGNFGSSATMPFLCWLFPNILSTLQSFNGVPITVIDRLRGQQLFQPLIVAASTSGRRSNEVHAASVAKASRERITLVVGKQQACRAAFQSLWEAEVRRCIQGAVRQLQLAATNNI